VTAGPTTIETGVGVVCDQLRHVYHLEDDEVLALDDVDLTVRGGESVALLGPSGSGKSTLLMLMAGLLRPTSGRLFLGADDMTRMTERELLDLRSQRIGVVAQGSGRNLLPYGSAEDNVRFAQRGVRGSRRGELPEPPELLRSLGLGDLAGRVAGRLSGGEQQRLAVAVAMASAPGLLLADEPTSQLDRDSAAQVIGLLRTANTDFGTTVIVVTHDQAVGKAFGRTVTIRDGKVGAEGHDGEDYLVVGRDGSVQLPPDLLDALPPGTLARAVRTEAGVEIRRADVERG